jgi:group I intron endonuclease
MAYGSIYLLRNSVNGKVYVGQTVGTIRGRWNGHRSDALKRIRQTPFHSAIRKYGPDNFAISQEATADSQQELDALEVQFITIYMANDRRYGYNVRSGGDGGGKHSLEARQRMSSSHRGKPSWNKGRQMDQAWRDRVRSQMQVRAVQMRGKPLSPEHRANISAALTSSQKVSASQHLRWSRPGAREAVSGKLRGRPVSAATREKISARLKGRQFPEWQKLYLSQLYIGRKHSPETLQKISNSLRGKKHSPKTIERIRIAQLKRHQLRAGGL